MLRLENKRAQDADNNITHMRRTGVFNTRKPILSTITTTACNITKQVGQQHYNKYE